MLSRVAANLFWIGRYLERAENVARLADAARSISILPGETQKDSEWASTLIAAGVIDGEGRLPNVTRAEAVFQLFFDEANPSSIRNCLLTARENARAIRSDLTQEVWEAINATWREYRDFKDTAGARSGLADLIDWVKGQCAEVRGTITGTMLRNDGYDFLMLGQSIERADSTARLLDVKYNVLLPSVDDVGSIADRQQWQAILHAASGQRAYTFVTKSALSRRGVSAFLILSTEFPRSILFNVNRAQRYLAQLEGYYGRPSGVHATLETLARELRTTSIDDIFTRGLHEFLSDTIERNYAVANILANGYGFGDPAQMLGQSQSQ
ncbi:MAG: alpha-E domain-containing protein [Shimia sp.]